MVPLELAPAERGERAGDCAGAGVHNAQARVRRYDAHGAVAQHEGELGAGEAREGPEEGGLCAVGHVVDDAAVEAEEDGGAGLRLGVVEDAGGERDGVDVDVEAADGQGH